jgi:Phosphotransferase enzyme family
LSRFFAESWKHTQNKPLDIVEAILHNYQQKLDLLSRALPLRFRESLRKVSAQLPLLFTSTYPLVLSHDDLCEMNILVDPNTGHITGIIDWADASILPFGICLWGFENVLGYMDSQGWHYYENHQTLEDLFWKTFEEAVGGVSKAEKRAIRVARVAGFFFRYGFSWEDGVREIPVKEPDSALRYLDAFCTTVDIDAVE